jgi:hypothetical protein
MHATMIGFDIAKSVFQVHGEDSPVVCVKFSKLVMVRVRWFIQVTRAASL